MPSGLPAPGGATPAGAFRHGATFVAIARMSAWSRRGSRRLASRAGAPVRPLGLAPWGRGLLVLLGAWIALAAGGRDAAGLHPMDGPDVDCRIRIDEESVRFQITMNLAFVDAVIEPWRELVDVVHATELDALRDELLDHFQATNAVAIDGVEVTPLLYGDEPFRFSPADPSLVPLFPRFGARSLAKVRLELEYPAKSRPSEVTMRWGSFPDNATLVDPDGNAPPIEINAQLRAGGIDELVAFTKDEPVATWSGTIVSPEERFQEVPEVLAAPTWVVPVPSLVVVLLALAWIAKAVFGEGPRRAARLRIAFVGLVVAVLLEPLGHARVPDPLATDRGLPDEIAAATVFRPLHANIYRAFDYDEEGDVYDALARSVEGPLLAELYGEIYASLVQEEAGGAVSRVRTVDVSEAEVSEVRRDQEGRPTFDVEATWQIEGVVFHWGHAHVRRNEYTAAYVVRSGDEGWRIAACEVLAERRLEAVPLPPGVDFEDRDAFGDEGFFDAPLDDGTAIPLGPGEDL